MALFPAGEMNQVLIPPWLREELRDALGLGLLSGSIPDLSDTQKVPVSEPGTGEIQTLHISALP